MFARRHPILFFLIMISACGCIAFFGFAMLIVAGAGMAGDSYSEPYMTRGGNIGIVEISGMIMSSKKAIHELNAFHKNDAIKIIIVRIDSPGGGIAPSQEIFRQINKIKQDKKVIVSMGSVAASGGYYIAAAADKIMANPGTITGSIGVIMEYANLMEIAKKIGISPVVIKSGEFKDMGSPLRELKPAEQKLFQALVDELHMQFVADMARSRGINIEQMKQLADGRVYTGQTAIDLNLIDRLGNLDDAIAWAGSLAGIKGELKPVYPPEDRMTFFRKLTQSLFKDVNISGTISDNFRYVIN